ncbi:MAG: 3D domain-containing protein [Tissierellia bacterium]|nr:3D domain-containing protein [Tissierellia bacterium]
MNFVKKYMNKSLLTGALAAVALLSMGAGRAKTITLVDDGVYRNYRSGAATVGEFLEEQEIQMEEGEVVFPGRSTELTEEMKLSLEEGFEITIVDGGESYKTSVKSLKVKDILRELGIALGEDDILSPAREEVLAEGQRLSIDRIRYEEETHTRALPFAVETRYSDELPQGVEQLVQEGAPGEITETVMVRYINGVAVQSVITDAVVTKGVQNKITQVGTQAPQAQAAPQVQAAPEDSSPEEVQEPVGENVINGRTYSRKIVMEATAYDPTAGSLTAMGTPARVGAVAVDRKVIPLGTELYIESTDDYPSYGFAVAEDVGSAIKGNRIDLFYNTNAQALQFGRRNVVVYVLD